MGTNLSGKGGLTQDDITEIIASLKNRLEQNVCKINALVELSVEKQRLSLKLPVVATSSGCLSLTSASPVLSS